MVYKGRLGLEDEAVMVGGKDLFEPHPVDSINVSDWECLQGTPYHVGDLTAYPPYNPPTQSQRDVDHDHVQDLFGPGFIPRHFLKTLRPGARPHHFHPRPTSTSGWSTRAPRSMVA